MPFLRQFYTVFNYSDPSITFYPAVSSKYIEDDTASIERWIVITLVIFSIVVLSVTSYLVYALYCKNPHRWLNTQI